MPTEATQLATSQLLTLSITLNALTNAFWSLQRFIFAEGLMIEKSPYNDANPAVDNVYFGGIESSVEWSYETDMREVTGGYVDAMFTAIVEELVVVGCELSGVVEKVDVIKAEVHGVGVGDLEEKDLEELVGRVKELEVGLWRDIEERPLVG